MSFDNFWKAVATITVWVICGVIGISVVMFSNGGYSWDMIGIPLIAAILATFFMWAVPELVKEDVEKARIAGGQSATEKQKRNATPQGESRLSMLMELMDDDEREAFKHTLKQRILAENRLSDDGEFYSGVPLNDLLAEDDADRQRNY
ncbi:MAG: hypothetical protein RLP44_20545 [Aggregatilineales bacterium]